MLQGKLQREQFQILRLTTIGPNKARSKPKSIALQSVRSSIKGPPPQPMQRYMLCTCKDGPRKIKAIKVSLRGKEHG